MHIDTYIHNISISRCLPATVCIRYMPSKHNCSVITIDKLSRKDELEIWNDALNHTEERHQQVLSPHDGTAYNYPTSIQIENTTKCNLRCIMCPQSLDILGGGGYITAQRVRADNGKNIHATVSDNSRHWRTFG
jgi:hypothetical protein